MDYKKLGFKAGLEIHQQLDSHKLFCNCPSVLRDDKPDLKIMRTLRAVPGEHGEIDVAAFYEQLKGKYFIYESYYDVNCEVELDEAPPYPINEDALKIGLTVAKMMHCETPDKVQVMRKTVVDGSNTSGFQRTVLIGKDGWIKVNKKKIGINFLILEEDAARRTAEDDHSVTYRLDRLGIPMLEVVTAPDMKTADEVKETAKVIGMLLRSTGKMRRGIGTIRQDVNISIKDHERVEMKGVQDLRVMHKYIEKEVKRQIETKGKEKPHVRNVKPDFSSKFLRPLPGAARMYPETDIPMVKPDLKGIKVVELIQEKTKRFEKLGLGKDLAPLVAGSERAELFEELVKKYKKIKPGFIAETLTGTLAELKRDYQIEGVSDSDLKKVFEYLNEGKIHKDIILSVLVDMAKDQFEIKKYEGLETEDLHEELMAVIKENKGAPFGALMGQAMAKLKGKASGEKVAKMLKELMEKGH